MDNIVQQNNPHEQAELEFEDFLAEVLELSSQDPIYHQLLELRSYISQFPEGPLSEEIKYAWERALGWLTIAAKAGEMDQAIAAVWELFGMTDSATLPYDWSRQTDHAWQEMISADPDFAHYLQRRLTIILGVDTLKFFEELTAKGILELLEINCDPVDESFPFECYCTLSYRFYDRLFELTIPDTTFGSPDTLAGQQTCPMLEVDFRGIDSDPESGYLEDMRDSAHTLGFVRNVRKLLELIPPYTNLIMYAADEGNRLEGYQQVIARSQYLSLKHAARLFLLRQRG